MEHVQRYRNATVFVSNELDALITNIDPTIYRSTIGRFLIAQELINKAESILLEDLDNTAAHEIISAVLGRRFSKKT